MKRRPCGTVRDSKSGRISCRTTEELGTGYKGNKRSTEEHEKAIQQEKVKFSRTEDWRQHVARSQEYLFKVTFKETRPKEIWTL